MAILEEFDCDIWISNGSNVSAVMGFHYPTRMAIIRLSDGSLFVWSPVQLSDNLSAEVDALGTVRYLVAPNSLHHLFLADWKRAYPDARIFAPPGLRKKREDIDFDEDLLESPNSSWAKEIDQVLVKGNRITTEVVFYHINSGTVLFTDLIQQFPPGWFSGWRAIVAWLDLMVADEPTVPRKFRLAFTDRTAARNALQSILAWPAKKVLMAHGQPVTRDGKKFLHRAFAWLHP